MPHFNILVNHFPMGHVPLRPFLGTFLAATKVTSIRGTFNAVCSAQISSLHGSSPIFLDSKLITSDYQQVSYRHNSFLRFKFAPPILENTTAADIPYFQKQADLQIISRKCHLISARLPRKNNSNTNRKNEIFISSARREMITVADAKITAQAPC